VSSRNGRSRRNASAAAMISPSATSGVLLRRRAETFRPSSSGCTRSM